MYVKRTIKRLVAVLVSMALVLTCLVGTTAVTASAATTFTAADLTAGMVRNDQERVDEITVAGRTCYMYVPESNRIGNFLGLTPMIMVLGDTSFTKESVLQTAQNDGFAEIAARDGVCILFVNPLESWDSQADQEAAAELFADFFQVYSSSPGLKFENGVAEKVINEETGETRNVYPGSIHGVQLFGEGKGADYIAANFMKNLTHDGGYAFQIFTGLSSCPSGVALFSPTKLVANPENGPAIPLAIVNGPDDAESVATSYNRAVGISKVVEDQNVDGFDKELVVSLYDEVVSKYYYSQGQFRESPKYGEKGIIEVNATKTLSSGKTIEYYEYIPDDLDFDSAGTVPLLMWFHGMGGEAEAMFSWTDWPIVAKENGFMVVSFDQHADYTSHEVMEVLDMILEEYLFVDTTRIYAGGFSLGGSKTWNLGFKYWDRFAGIVPTALGVFPEGTDAIEDYIDDDVILPVFYIAGGVSPLPELPAEEGGIVNEALGYLWRTNMMAEDYAFDPDAGNRWGVEADTVTEVPYKDESDLLKVNDDQLTISSFESTNGETYTYLVINENKPHTVTANDAHVAWEYISQFSRNADKTISVNGVAALPFSDVRVDAWYVDAVKYVYENSMMAGTGNTTFEPETNLTRAMTAQILYNLEGKPEVAEAATFTDMNTAPDWSEDAIAWAQNTGVVSGIGGGLFDPNANVTRQEFAQMLYNYAKYKGYDLTAAGDLSQFPDSGSVADWAERAMSWANGNELINGHDDGTIDATGTTIRAQAASILMNFDLNLVK